MKGYSSLKKEIDQQISQNHPVSQYEETTDRMRPSFDVKVTNSSSKKEERSKVLSKGPSITKKSGYKGIKYSNEQIDDLDDSTANNDSLLVKSNENKYSSYEDKLAKSNISELTAKGQGLTPSGDKVKLSDLEDKDKYYNKYNKLSQLATNNLDDFRELSSKADRQLQELEKMLSKKGGESEETDNRSSTRYINQYNDMLKETTQRPSAIRKYDDNGNLLDTKEQVLANTYKN